tara:strand:- start:463 stop:1158 length:696 start_codon:yes stop_codon:yes gene_type:complete
MNTNNISDTIPFQRVQKKLLSPWFFISFILFIGISYFYLDQPIALYFQSLDLNETASWIRWITHLGLGGSYIIGLFFLALFFRYIKKNRDIENKTWFLWFCVILPSLICVGLKFMLGRARPILLFNHDIYGFHGLESSSVYWSFPSGHTTTIMGFVLGLSIVFPKGTYGFIITGLIIAVSRVLLTNHYLSDVLTAAYLAFLEVSILFYYVEKKQLWHRDILGFMAFRKHIH